MIDFLQDLAQTHGGLAMVLGLWGCATLAVWAWERFTNVKEHAPPLAGASVETGVEP